MTAADLRRRTDRLEAGTAEGDRSAIVIYQPGETDEEIRARIPPGAETVIFLPDNGRDRPAGGP